MLPSIGAAAAASSVFASGAASAAPDTDSAPPVDTGTFAEFARQLDAVIAAVTLSPGDAGAARPASAEAVPARVEADPSDDDRQDAPDQPTVTALMPWPACHAPDVPEDDASVTVGAGGGVAVSEAVMDGPAAPLQRAGHQHRRSSAAAPVPGHGRLPAPAPPAVADNEGAQPVTGASPDYASRTLPSNGVSAGPSLTPSTRVSVPPSAALSGMPAPVEGDGRSGAIDSAASRGSTDVSEVAPTEVTTGSTPRHAQATPETTPSIRTPHDATAVKNPSADVDRSAPDAVPPGRELPAARDVQEAVRTLGAAETGGGPNPAHDAHAGSHGRPRVEVAHTDDQPFELRPGHAAAATAFVSRSEMAANAVAPPAAGLGPEQVLPINSVNAVLPGVTALLDHTVAPAPLHALGGAPTDVPDPEFPSRLVQSFRMQAIRGGGDAVVQIRPDHLGPVTISLRVDAGVVSAQILAADPRVVGWLHAHQDGLREALQQNGLTLERLVIEQDRRDPDRRERRREAPPKPRYEHPADRHSTFELTI